MRRYLLPLAVLTWLVFAPTGGTAWNRYVAPVGYCANDRVADRSPAVERRSMMCLVNYARARRGIPRLKESPLLRRAAALKISADERCREFSHAPCGRPFTETFRAVGYIGPTWSYAVGENLAWGQNVRGTPRQIINSWLNSPHHRENIFNPRYRETGIGFDRPSSFLTYPDVAIWANTFGIRSR